jgi:ABC-type transporter Mla subunit MlaD
MRPDPKAAFAVGLVALFTIIAFGVALALDPGLISRRVTWIAHFESVADLAEGAPVTAYGRSVGQVGRRTWIPASQTFRVELLMDPDWKPGPGIAMRVEQTNPLRYATVAQVEATCDGTRTPEVSEHLVHDAEASGDEHLVATCPRLPGLFDIATTLLARLETIAEQVQALAGSPGSNAGSGQIAQATRMEQVADNLTAMSGSLRTLVEQLGALQPELRQTLTAAHDLTADADQMVRRTDATLDAVSRDTLSRLNHTLDGTDQLVRAGSAPLQASLGDLRYILGASSGSVVRLAAQADMLSANLAELTRQLRDNPASLLRGRSLTDPPEINARRP